MGACGNVCCVASVFKGSVFGLGVLKYVVYSCKGCDGIFIIILNLLCIVRRGAVDARV